MFDDEADHVVELDSEPSEPPSPDRLANASPAILSVRDLYQWPQRVAKALCDPSAVCRLHALLMDQVIVCSDYSGYGSEKEALTCVWRSMCAEHSWQFDKSPFVFARGCDIGRLPQQILISLSKAELASNMCVLQDVVEHCHPNAVQWLRAAQPGEDATPEDAKRAYDQILEWLLQNRSWALPLTQKQKCLVHTKHGGRCFVNPLAEWSANLEVLTCQGHCTKRRKLRREASMGAGETAEATDGLDSAGAHTDAAATGPGLETSPEAAPEIANRVGIGRPLSIILAGVTCDGWSTMGTQRRYTHKSELAHHVWVVERRARAEQAVEDIAFVECTKRYPVAVKLAPLQVSHRILHIQTDPMLFGFPISRPRVFAACLNLTTVAWLGPDNWQEDFADKFYEACVLSGDALFAAPSSERLQMYQNMAAQQKNYSASSAKLADLPVEDLFAVTMAPGQQDRAAKYIRRRQTLEGPCGNFLFDVDHHEEARKMCGRLFPCLLTHGCVVSAPRNKQARIATAMEHCGAQGLHLFPATCQDNPRSPLEPIFRSLKAHQVKQVSGRAIHLAALSAWMWYVLSHTVPHWWKAYPLEKRGSWNTEADNEDAKPPEDL